MAMTYGSHYSAPYPTKSNRKEVIKIATKVQRYTEPDYNQPLVIERRDIVATIVPDQFGTRDIIDEAFSQISSYLRENLGAGPMVVSFDYYGRTWSVEVGPSDPPNSDTD